MRGGGTIVSTYFKCPCNTLFEKTQNFMCICAQKKCESMFYLVIPLALDKFGLVAKGHTDHIIN